MRWVFLLGVLLGLGGCMKVSDMAGTVEDQLRDVGVLDHSQMQRFSGWRLQPDSSLLVAQGPFRPSGAEAVPDNQVATVAFDSFVQYFPMIHRADRPLYLPEALAEARSQGQDYLLYGRLAQADDRIGSLAELVEQPAVNRLGLDSAVVQVMLIETGTQHLVDSVTIRSRGGVLSWYDHRTADFLGPPLQRYARQLLGLRND